MIRLWSARLLAAAGRAFTRWSDTQYRRHYARQNREAQRRDQEGQLAEVREKRRVVDAVVDALIAGKRP